MYPALKEGARSGNESQVLWLNASLVENAEMMTQPSVFMIFLSKVSLSCAFTSLVMEGINTSPHLPCPVYSRTADRVEYLGSWLCMGVPVLDWFWSNWLQLVIQKDPTEIMQMAIVVNSFILNLGVQGIHYFVRIWFVQDKRINSMSVPLPSATVTVVGVGLGSKAAGFTNKNPDFPFLQLHPIQGGVFLFASSAGFGLHGRKVDLERLSFPINADGRTFRNDNGSGVFRT